MKRVFAKEEHCIACRLCEVWCAVEHSPSRKVYKYRTEKPIPRIEVQFDSESQNSIAMQCRHCEDAPCIDACMTGALIKLEDGRVDYIEDKCVGCWMCIMSCPYGVIRPIPEQKKIAKCDLCPHLETPACVEHCPTAALVFVETGDEYHHEPLFDEGVDEPLFIEG